MLRQRFLLRPMPVLSFSLLTQNSLSFPLQTTSHSTNFSSFSSSLYSRSSFLSFRPFPSRSSPCTFFSSEAVLEIARDVESSEEYHNEIESEDEDFGAEREEFVSGGLERVLDANNKGLKKHELPILSVKEKKELASYAHSLGKKLKSQQVGKSGVTDTVVTALIETLEKNELLKLKIHNSCPGELDDVVKQIEEGTGSVVVGQIGRTVILYRPSLTKLKLEEKKKQAQRILLKKHSTLKPFQNKSEQPRQYGRGRRGSSRPSGYSRRDAWRVKYIRKERMTWSIGLQKSTVICLKQIMQNVFCTRREKCTLYQRKKNHFRNWGIAHENGVRSSFNSMYDRIIHVNHHFT